MPDEFNPEDVVRECLERIDTIIEQAFGLLDGTPEMKKESEIMMHVGSELSPRAIANSVEEELADLEDWIEVHLKDFCGRRGLVWERRAHLRFAPRPGWIADGCRDQLDSIESALRTMRELCLEYGPHCEENSGMLAAARRVADALQNPIEGYKAYIGGHKNQVAERDFTYRFQIAGADIGNACAELGSEIVTDMRRELRRLYRDVEIAQNTNGEQGVTPNA
jgi:hypothetical protein